MTNIDIDSEEWDREAIDMETKLGGIRIGPIKPLGTPTDDCVNTMDDEEALQREEKMLRQKLIRQLKQMKERETNGREYLLKHGIILKQDVPESLGVYV